MSSSHKFQEKTFTRLTYCDYCTKLLWGVAKQGVTCEGCGFNCHRKCSELVYANCVRSMYIPSADDLKRSATSGGEGGVTSGTNTGAGAKSSSKTAPRRSFSEGMRVSIPPAIVSSSQPLQSLVEKPPKQEPAPVSATPTTKPTKASFLEEAIISAAIRMSLPANVSALPQNDHPTLSIQTTTINFTRFVHKSTAMFWFQDKVEDILTWKDPWNTTFVLSARQQQKILGIKPNVSIPQSSSEEANNHNTDAYHTGHDEDYLEHHSSSESEEEEKERQSRAVQYLSNLQHIQNMMGDISEAHDVIRPLFKHLDWSDEAEAIMIVQGVMAAFIGMSLVMWFVPWRWVFMMGGASGILANSPWGKVFVKECKPLAKDIAAWAQIKAKTFKQY
ncbi:hypothetical protein BGX26_004724 [Mortierella sp. AD094]|nr:hypothetical protein BGX26_004724 [Mortierella sp. AD094]